MRNLLLFSIFITCFFSSFSQNRSLSEESEISILTIGPGNYLYDKFGHSAIRVQDKRNNVDAVFNYGTYDFNTPNFYTKFAQGKLLYSLSISDFHSFFQHYQQEDRWITEQVLDLNKTQKKEIFDLLVENSKPENREYLYDFTHDNCATKIRDVLSIGLGNNLEYNTDLTEGKSFRKLIQENLHQNTWGSLGIDLALGAPIDRKATKLEQQFLPDYVLKANEEAKIKTDAENWKPLVKETKELYKQQEKKKSSGFLLTSPWVVFSILGILLIVFSFRDILQKKRTKSIDIIVFSFTGIIGIVIALLWFATDHTATKLNYNILWAFPISLLFMKAISKDSYSKRLLHYLNLLSILVFLLFFHWITGVQKYPYSIFILLIGLLIRYRYLVRFYKNSMTNSTVSN